MTDLESIKATFFEECSELMEQLEAGLLALQSEEGDDDTVDSIFRAVHSIKGGAGAFHLSNLVDFAHEYETVLDGLRNGRLSPDRDVVAVLLRACDNLGDLVRMAQDGGTEKMPVPQDLLDLGTRMADAGQPEEDDDPFGLGFVPLTIDIPEDIPTDPPEPEQDATAAEDFEIFSAGEEKEPSPDQVKGWEITFRPFPELLETGNEPLFLFRSLQVLGPLDIRVDEEHLPPLDALDTAVVHLSWTIFLRPSAPDLTETEIEIVFEFTDYICDLVIKRCMLPAAQASSAPPKNPVEPTPSPAPKPVAKAPPENLRPSTETAPKTPVAEAKSGGQKTTLASSIRVDLDRVDRLVNLVGELVISQSMLAQSILADGLDTNSQSASGLDDLQQLTRDIQDSVMAIRAQPVRSLFQRMTRIVREAAQMTAKDVVLETDGETTEIDKTVVERLADPLTHMIRNAIDHGLEGPDDRVAQGKPRTGQVRLTARQQSDRVVIEVSDDGRGIDRARVLERAIDRGLVPANKSLEPAEIDRLLFLPGFSTATDVSALSGRGVGMDVVQRAISDLNGTVSITSAEGAGTTFSV
ncbi:MAG: chemotaxis protein CheA, partial [Pseudomonadota bacterium]